MLVPTLLLGRVFCNWMCPYGTLHQLAGWLFNIRRNKDLIDSNRYRHLFQTKYVILTVMLVMAAMGSLQIGLLDPICLLVRTFATAFVPAADVGLHHLESALVDHGVDANLSGSLFKPGITHARIFAGAWFVGLVIVFLVGMNLVIPRFFCRVLCPSGRSSGCSRASLSGASIATSPSAPTATSA